MTQTGGLTNGDSAVDSNGQLEASPSDSDSGSSLSSYGGGSFTSQSGSNEGVVFPNQGGASSGSEGSDSEDVRSKIDQLRTVATLLKRKADDLEASL